MALAAACFAICYPGCAGSEEISSITSGYSFMRDLDGERLILLIDPSPEAPVSCMKSELPPSGGVVWRKTELEPSRLDSLRLALLDESRFPSYEEDTEETDRSDIVVCDRSPGGAELCYIPSVQVTAVADTWRFGIHPDVSLSDETQELIDQFLLAHEACWESAR
jgi:hypothetical protein